MRLPLFVILIVLLIALIAYILVCISYIKNRKLKPKQESNSKKTRKTVLVAITVIIVCITAGCLIANRVYHTCGDGVTWSLRGDVFIVKSSSSGGSIDEIDYAGKGYISEIIIEPGVETISFNAFEGFHHLQKVTIPNTVKLIDEYAFNCCDYDSFYSVYFEGTEEEWNQIEIRERGNELFLQKIKNGCLDMDVWGYAGMDNFGVEESTTLQQTDFATGAQEISIPETTITIEHTEFSQTQANHTSEQSQIITTTKESTANLSNIVGSGICGENVTWTLYNDGELVISGSGWMNDYGNGSDKPWYDYRNNMLRLTVENGVKGIGSNAFSYCSFEDVFISKSVTSIGHDAFWNCTKLKNVVFESGSNLEIIGEAAFVLCTSIKNINIPKGVTDIGRIAFGYCYSLETITIPNSVKNIGGSMFFLCDNLTDIFYEGTKEQWDKIIIDDENDEWKNEVAIHYNA